MKIIRHSIPASVDAEMSHMINQLSQTIEIGESWDDSKLKIAINNYNRGEYQQAYPTFKSLASEDYVNSNDRSGIKIYEVTATLVNNRIYFNGGWNGSSSSDFFFLNVSVPFTTNSIASMPWTDLSLIPGLIIRSGHTACINETNKNLIIYIGRAFMIETDLNFTSVFDTTTQKWSMPEMEYVYGGGDNALSMIKLDISSSIWTTLSGIMAPLATE
ncbi:9740_t:CDS:2, partial [Gigaspora margarita]